jgi:hypothetical protein
MLLFFIAGIADAQTLDKKLNSTQSVLREEDAKEIVSRVLKTSPVIDGHNDLFIHYFGCKDCPKDIEDYPLDSITRGHTDIIRWRKGGVGGQLLNVWNENIRRLFKSVGFTL